MVRICVLGDSHAGCIKRAWDQDGARYPETELTFFAARQGGLMGLKPVDGVLMPSNDELRAAIRFTSGGLESLDLKQFDHVLLVGLLTIYPKIEECKSLDVAGRIASLQLRNTLGHLMMMKIRKVDRQIPVWSIHRPLRSSAIAPSDQLGPEAYSHIIQQINAQFMAGFGAHMFEQPAETILNTFNTRPEFSVGSHRLDVGMDDVFEHKSHDDIHMNETFGSLCLARDLPTIMSHRAVSAGLPANAVRAPR